MQIKGVVKCLSPNRNRVAALTDYGYVVFDLIDGEVDKDDVIIGDLDDHGAKQVTNLTRKQRLSVYIEAIQATSRSALTLLSYS